MGNFLITPTFAPRAVPAVPVVTGTPPAVPAVPVGHQVCAAHLPLSLDTFRLSAHRHTLLTHRHTAPPMPQISWCARAEQRYAKEPALSSLLPAEVRTKG